MLLYMIVFFVVSDATHAACYLFRIYFVKMPYFILVSLDDLLNWTILQEYHLQ